MGISESNSTSSESIIAANKEGSELGAEFNATLPIPYTIYGHIHMAKTGGTNLNVFLANNFEKVCGHKGYSYDAYQSNERFSGYVDRVDPDEMQKIGFEECNFISHEIGFEFWLQFDDFHDTPMELHLPCRDPIDHLMSQCNHRRRSFDCLKVTDDDEEMMKLLKPCLIFMNRFHDNLHTMENVHLKCYDFRYQFTHYMDYISAKLRKRRFVSDYKKRETNRKRVKENECIWEDKVAMQRVKSFLVNKIPYYNFCRECLGSENDLTREVI